MNVLVDERGSVSKSIDGGSPQTKYDAWIDRMKPHKSSGAIVHELEARHE
jgi:hypothetical protein